MHKCHTCGKQHFPRQTGPEKRSHYENYTGLIAITLRVFFILSNIKKYDNMVVVHQYDVVFYNARFHNIVPNNFNQSTLICVVWYGMVWYGTVWYGMVWCGMVWCGMVWYGVVWCGMVWYGVVWCGIVWYGVVWFGLFWFGGLV